MLKEAERPEAVRPLILAGKFSQPSFVWPQTACRNLPDERMKKEQRDVKMAV